MQAESNLIQMNATCLFYELTAFHSFKIQDFILVSKIHSLHTHTHTKKRKKEKGKNQPPKKTQNKKTIHYKNDIEKITMPKRSEMAIQQLN